ncbi:hypothetical protein MMC09_004236 [Bachmanniomyces sp. S44760]|nr:hypothetical protein [Bachmanniomyces sp. S44760]
MPVSHIGLNVSHLPKSCSFFLASLSPLGYKYIGNQNNEIGFGITQADFFLRQQATETSKPHIGATNIAFAASDINTVDDFYAAALKAGAYPQAAPALISDNGDSYYSATVLDPDDNAIEVIHHPREIDNYDEAGMPSDSRVLNWQKDVARNTATESTSSPRRIAASSSRITGSYGHSKPKTIIIQPPSSRYEGKVSHPVAPDRLFFPQNASNTASFHPSSYPSHSLEQNNTAKHAPRSLTAGKSQYTLPYRPSTSTYSRAIEAPPLSSRSTVSSHRSSPSSRISSSSRGTSTIITLPSPPTQIKRYASPPNSPLSPLGARAADSLILSSRVPRHAPRSNSHSGSNYGASRASSISSRTMTMTMTEGRDVLPLRRTGRIKDVIYEDRVYGGGGGGAGAGAGFSHSSSNSRREGRGRDYDIVSVAPSDSISQVESYASSRGSRRSFSRR